MGFISGKVLRRIKYIIEPAPAKYTSTITPKKPINIFKVKLLPKEEDLTKDFHCKLIKRLNIVAGYFVLKRLVSKIDDLLQKIIHFIIK